MKRLKVILRVVVIGLALLAIAAVVIYFTALPAIARGQIASMLRRAGIDDAAFVVRHVTLEKILLEQVTFGQPQWAQAAKVSATYSLQSLWNGRIHSLTIDDARWNLKVDADGRVQWGPKAQSQRSSASKPPDRVPFDLPLDSLTIRSSQVVLALAEGASTFNIDGTLSRNASGEAAAALTLAADGDVTLPGQVRIVGLAADLRLNISTTRTATVINVQQPSVIAAGELHAGQGDSALHTSAVRMALQQHASEPLLRMTTAPGAGRSLEIQGGLISEQPLAVQWRDGRASITRSSLAATVRQAADQPLRIESSLTLQDGIVQMESKDLLLHDVDAIIPLHFNSPATAAPISIEAVAWKQQRYAGLTGSIGINDLLLQAQLNWPLLEQAPLTARAEVDLRSRPMRGELAAQLPSFSVSDPAALGDLAPQLAGVQVGGTYGLDATVRWQGSDIQPLIQLHASDASLQHPDWPIEITSADAALTIVNVSPLSTAPNQQIVVASAYIGEHEVQGGRVVFTASADRVAVQQLSWDMGSKGRFRTSAFVFDPRDPVIHAQLYCDDVSLEEWLPLFTNDHASGEGTLQGQLAVEIDLQSRQKVFFGRGWLRALDEGLVQAHDADALSQFLDESNPRFRTDPQLRQVKSSVIDALEDFAYNSFEVQLTPGDDNHVPFQVRLHGRGRRGPHPQELNLTLNVNDFNRLVWGALWGKSLLDLGE